MEYRVEEIATRAGVGVDTVRFYQTRGLLPLPRREGRIALYGALHLERLQKIRALLSRGFTLALIKRYFERGEEAGEGKLLRALVYERVGECSFTRAELAAAAGVPEAVIAAVQSGGLFEAVVVDGEERFGETDLEMARAALAILQAGFPADELIRLATDHARGVDAVTGRAVELFERYVRKNAEGELPSERVAQIFEALLPQVTRLVALHFQRSLVSRALRRLTMSSERSEFMQAAVGAVRDARLERLGSLENSESLESAWHARDA